MPDHQHLIITGTCSDSDIWKAIVSYRQKTGFWMSMNKTGIRWQKDFYDHVIRRHEDIAVVAAPFRVRKLRRLKPAATHTNVGRTLFLSHRSDNALLSRG